MLALVLVFCLVTCVAPSASASESSWLELLDYTTLRDSGSNRGDTNQEIWYDLPFDMDLYAVDILIKITPTGPGYPSGPSVNGISCTMDRITDSIYRIYGGSSALRPGQKSVALNFSSVPYPAYIEILSFRVSSVYREVYGDVGTIELDGITSTMTSPGVPVAVTKSSVSTYNGSVTFSSWRKYDSVGFRIGVMTDSISSIVVSYGGVPVSADISYFQLADNDRMYYLSVIVDVSSMDKDISSPLLIDIDGNNTSSSVYSLELLEVVGYIDVASPSPLVFFFNNLFSKLGSWFDGVKNTVSTGFSNLANWLSSGFQSVVNKLDELIDGSSNGTSDQIKDDLGSVGDFEDRYHDTVEGNWGDVSGSLDQVVGGSNFIGAASFYSDIVQTIFESVPDYGVVLTAVLCVFVVFSLL